MFQKFKDSNLCEAITSASSPAGLVLAFVLLPIILIAGNYAAIKISNPALIAAHILASLGAMIYPATLVLTIRDNCRFYHKLNKKTEIRIVGVGG